MQTDRLTRCFLTPSRSSRIYSIAKIWENEGVQRNSTKYLPIETSAPGDPMRGAVVRLVAASSQLTYCNSNSWMTFPSELNFWPTLLSIASPLRWSACTAPGYEEIEFKACAPHEDAWFPCLCKVIKVSNFIYFLTGLPRRASKDDRMSAKILKECPSPTQWLHRDIARQPSERFIQRWGRPVIIGS